MTQHATSSPISYRSRIAVRVLLALFVLAPVAPALPLGAQPKSENVGEPTLPPGPIRVSWLGNHDTTRPMLPQVFAIEPSPEAAANAAALPPLEERGHVPKYFLPGFATSPLVGAAGPWVRVVPTSLPSVSPPLIGFETQDYDDNGTLTGFSFIPPDPNGTVGPNHVLVVNNVLIGAYDKAAPNAQVFLQSLQTFFGGTPTFTFDPKALYDQFNNRYLVVTLEQEEGGANPSPSNASRILIAGSPLGTPSGTWNAFTINAQLAIGSPPSRQCWCDYPGFAVDEESLYITCNYFEFDNGSGSRPYCGSRLYTVDKVALYSGGTPSVFLYDPGSASGTTSCTFTLQPAHVHTDPGGTIGTWLAAFGGCSSSPFGTPQFLHVIRVDNPLGGDTASFTGWFPALGSICTTPFCAVPNAPQPPGAVSLDTVGNRTYDAEWRVHPNTGSGNLYVTTTTDATGTEAGQAMAHWFQMDTDVLAASAPNTSPPVTNQGDVGAEDLGTGTHTYFPAISVNDNCAMVGFSASSASLFAGAYYAPIDVYGIANPAGTALATQTLRIGDDLYQRTFGGSLNRWGDYSGLVLDFTNPGTFWIFNEYARMRGGGTPPEDGRWGQFAGADVCPAALPVELERFEAVLDGQTALLAWRTASETNNAGFEIEQRYFDGDFVRVAFVDGRGTTLEPQSYRYRIDDLHYGPHAFRLKQIDFDGSFEYSPEIEVFVEVPSGYVLSAAHPNPFNSQTQFTLMVATAQQVVVAVYDVTGRRVAVLHDGPLTADALYRFTFDASDQPSGVYFVRVIGQRFTASRSTVLMK